MTAVTEASVPLITETGTRGGALRISLLPGQLVAPDPLVDATSDSGDPELEPYQLLEDCEYLYVIELMEPAGSVTTNHPDILFPDAIGGTRGRLRTKSHTGLLPIAILTEGRTIGTATLEVRSRKLDYLTQYRWMLRDLTDAAGSIVLERFAPTELRVTPLELLDPQSAYERFVLLQSILEDVNLAAAFEHIVNRPHRDWHLRDELRPPGRGIPNSSAVRKQLTRPGPRVHWPNSSVDRLSHLPKLIGALRPEETLDTPPNRFIKFVLGRWLSVVLALRRVLEAQAPSAPVDRGLRETQAMLDRLAAMLAEPLLREVGELTHFPANNQVLQKREGYLDFMTAYVRAEGALQMSWQGGNEVFGAGQRNVATLYEFWAYMQVLLAIKSLCNRFNDAPLIQPTRDGVGLALKRGNESKATGVAERLGRAINVEVVFNRRFPSSADATGSWTVAMQPDCSLHMWTADKELGDVEDVWLHLDAKYRIDRFTDIVGSERGAADEEAIAAVTTGEAKREDLLKMHAYRDAIRRSAGAYVLYPGDSAADAARAPFTQYQEILPGLGAFALRPSDSGTAEGLSALRKFLDDVLVHLASVISQDRRGRFWEATSFAAQTRVARATGSGPKFKKPPADTIVLLGYVRSLEHLHWIKRELRYNLRVGRRRGAVGLKGRELAADVVALYGPALEAPEFWRVTGEPEIWKRERLIQTGYVAPGGDLYFCLPLDEHVEATSNFVTNQRLLEARTLLSPAAASGEPVIVSWLDLVR